LLYIEKAYFFLILEENGDFDKTRS
jgi:hypothetical protein